MPIEPRITPYRMFRRPESPFVTNGVEESRFFGEIPENVQIVVGIPSFNEASYIGNVIKMVDRGLSQYFPKRSAVIVVADNNSTDGTYGVVSGTKTKTPKIYATTPQGEIGKGRNVRNVFQIAKQLGAEGVALIDSDLLSIELDWIYKLLSPVIEDGVIFVAPRYTRDKNDGTITNTISYPLTRALYGINIRQPMGGDFGLSDGLVGRLLETSEWDDSTLNFGIDMFITLNALQAGGKIREAHLGTKIHKDKDPSGSLGPMFQQAISTQFGMMNGDNQERWMNVSPGDGNPYLTLDGGTFKPVKVSFDSLRGNFVRGFRDYHEMLKNVLEPDDLSSLTRSVDSRALMSQDLWARIVYSFAVQFNFPRNGYDPKEIVNAMEPLYYGFTLSSLSRAENDKPLDFERRVHKLFLHFVNEKRGHLIPKWKFAASQKEFKPTT